MIKGLKKEIQKIQFLKYPVKICDVLQYFLENETAEYAFVSVNTELKQISFKEILPLLLSCSNGDHVCETELPEILFKNPVMVNIEDKENIVVQKISQAVEKEFPLVIYQKNGIVGQIPFKKLILFVKNCEIKEAIFVNPLTGLPGNYQIQQHYLVRQEPFSIAYFDFNNFKPFNDKYGFAKGDEAIKFAAVTLKKYFPECFMGHIGGDDFVIIGNFSQEHAMKAIEEFNKEVIVMHPEKDVKQGFIMGMDRYGKITKFPLLSGSLAVIYLTKKIDYSEITQELANIKSIAKNKLNQNLIPFEYKEI